MRLIKIVTVILAVIVLVGGTVLWLTSLGKDDAPVIKSTEETTITGTVATTDEELLKYVTAHDKQDGDLTASVKVIRKKYFIEDKTTIITFAVCDKDNNVSSIQRKLILSDYYSPRIEMKSDFIFPGGYNYNLADYVSAVDCIDGDISNYMKLISADFTNIEGTYPVNIKISNSMADSTSLTINAIVTDKDYFNVKIRLNNYISYVPVGSTVDYAALIKDIYNKTDNTYSTEDITIDYSLVDMSKPGVYDVFYRLYNGEDLASLTRLVVVVTEG